MATPGTYKQYVGKTFDALTVLNLGPRIQTAPGRTRPTYIVHCTCGVEKQIRCDYLLRKRKPIRSCGCSKLTSCRPNLEKAWAADSRKHLDPYIVERNRRFRNYRQGAKTRGYSFSLTVEEFESLENQPCHYCGQTPSPQNGIDRKDNNQGYTFSNCLPCCWPCNRAKVDQPYDEFMSWVERLVKHRVQVA
jgi:hypothetical protein